MNVCIGKHSFISTNACARCLVFCSMPKLDTGYRAGCKRHWAACSSTYIHELKHEYRKHIWPHHSYYVPNEIMTSQQSTKLPQLCHDVMKISRGSNRIVAIASLSIHANTWTHGNMSLSWRAIIAGIIKQTGSWWKKPRCHLARIHIRNRAAISRAFT